MREKMAFENTLSPVAYTASGSAVLFGMNAMDLAAFVGAGVAIATFLVNWYYKAKVLRESAPCPVKSCPVRDSCAIAE